METVRKPGLDQAEGTDKAKLTFNLRRGCKLCLQELNHLIVTAGATQERSAFNLAMHYILKLTSNIKACSNCQQNVRKIRCLNEQL